jgi:hypothetical protein
MSVGFVLAVFLSIGLGPLLVFEGLRFNTLHQTCKTTQIENERILTNPLCKDPWQRQLHGPKQEAVCKHAQEEMMLSPFSCAWKNLWSQSELVRVWFMITESYVMILSVVVPCLITCIFMLFWTCNEAKTRTFHQEMYRETLKTIHRNPIKQHKQQHDYVEYRKDESDFYLPKKNRRVIELINARN